MKGPHGSLTVIIDQEGEPLIEVYADLSDPEVVYESKITVSKGDDGKPKFDPIEIFIKGGVVHRTFR